MTTIPLNSACILNIFHSVKPCNYFFLSRSTLLNFLMFYSNKIGDFFTFQCIKSHFYVVKLFKRTIAILTVSSDYFFSKSDDKNAM